MHLKKKKELEKELEEHLMLNFEEEESKKPIVQAPKQVEIEQPAAQV